MILVKSYVDDHVGRRLAELRTVKGEHFGTECWITWVILTEFFPGDPDGPPGPDVVSFRHWDASGARGMHLGAARSIAGRNGSVRTEIPGLVFA